MPPALGVQSLNQWTTRQVLKCNLTYVQALGEARPAHLSEEGAAFTQRWTKWGPESKCLISKRSQELHDAPESLWEQPYSSVLWFKTVPA